MELSVYEMYPIDEEYTVRECDNIVTYGIFKTKGVSGKYHDCHVKIKTVFRPVKIKEQIMREQNMRIKELEDEIRQLQICDSLNNIVK